MSAFLIHKHHNPLGEKLREVRLNKGITLKKASADLNIASRYLEAIENFQPSMLPGKEYFDKFLTVYAKYLGIKEEDVANLRSLTAENKKRSTFGDQNLLSVYDWIVRGLIVLAIAGFLFFLVFRINAIFMPPQLMIAYPQDGLITNERQLQIKGNSVVEAEVVINNRAVLVSPTGEFLTMIDLQSGLNLIKITAKKRYSRINEIEIRVLLKE
jgi:transcriptional regulator with XRE-family HTH domain